MTPRRDERNWKSTGDCSKAIAGSSLSFAPARSASSVFFLTTDLLVMKAVAGAGGGGGIGASGGAAGQPGQKVCPSPRSLKQISPRPTTGHHLAVRRKSLPANSNSRTRKQRTFPGGFIKSARRDRMQNENAECEVKAACKTVETVRRARSTGYTGLKPWC